MIVLFIAIFFSLGLIIGSFLNVVIYRLNTKKTLGGRSACLSCQSQLAWYELIPLFSFIALGGRCKNCKTKISLQYLLVELVTGLIFALLFLKFKDILLIDTFSFALTYKYYAIMFSILLVISVYDLRHKIIPDALSFIFGVFAFLGLFFFSNNFFASFSLHTPSFLEFSSGPMMALPFLILWLISRGAWIGFGDVKLALGLGWFLGFSMALSALAVAFWSGAIVGLSLVVLSKINQKYGKLGIKSEIPFAPFLVLGAFLAFIFEFNFFNF